MRGLSRRSAGTGTARPQVVARSLRTTGGVSLRAATTVSASFSTVNFPLTVTRAGAGTGTVTSAPAGISCGADCTESYAQNTAVTLTANKDAATSPWRTATAYDSLPLWS